MSVSVVSCVYGETFGMFAPRWAETIAILDPAPDAVIVAADRRHHIASAQVYDSVCRQRHPQAYYLNEAISHVETDWVWIVDIDDFAKRDGLRGIEDVQADVWQMGYERSDGEVYVPEPVTAYEYLTASRNMLVAGSAFRTDAFTEAGGFSDIALQDWGLWRRLMRDGATFAFSDRAHYVYMRHEHTRGETELGIGRRPEHLAEMMRSEAVAVA